MSRLSLQYLALYKLGIVLLNLVPYLALRITLSWPRRRGGPT